MKPTLHSDTTKTYEKPTEKNESRQHNSPYPKVAVYWLNQALYSYQSLYLVDSEVQNPISEASNETTNS
jgi:hypothetical protein